MRILIICHYVLPHYGGIEAVVDQLSSFMIQHGHDVHILTSHRHDLRQERDGRQIIHVKAWNALEQYGVPYPLFSWRLPFALASAVRWADVVHVHGFLYQNSILALCLAKWMQRPTVLTEHAGFVRYPSSFLNVLEHGAIAGLGRLAIHLSDAVAVNPQAGKTIRPLLARHRGPVMQITHGIDTDFFSPPAADQKMALRQLLQWDERPKVLCVGRGVTRKGMDILVDSHEAEFDLVMCGRGISRSIAEKRGVLVYDGVGEQTLRTLYQASDLFVMPSWSEGWIPLAVQQAMSCGLPVLMLSDGERVHDGCPALMVPRSAHALQQRMRALLSDPLHLRVLGERSLQWAREHCDGRQTAAQYLALYERVIRC